VDEGGQGHEPQPHRRLPAAGEQRVEADPAAGLVDEQPHQLAALRALQLDVDELEAPVGRHARGDGPHPLNRPFLPRQFYLQKKEWATPLWSCARCQNVKCSSCSGRAARKPSLRRAPVRHFERVTRPVAVDPDAALATEAKRRGWPVLSLR